MGTQRTPLSAVAALALLGAGGMIAVSGEDHRWDDDPPPPPRPKPPEQIGPESRQVRRARERREAKANRSREG
jgi:hypothetical protein